MAFCFEIGEGVATAVQRMAAEQTDNAITYLATYGDGEGESAESAIHNTRKTFKRLRSLLRLARPALGNKQYRYENKSYRDASRAISALRDSTVLIETATAIGYSAEIDAQLLHPLLSQLKNQRTDIRRQQQGQPALVHDQLLLARQRIDQWQFNNDSMSAIIAGLARTWQKGQHEFQLATNTRDPHILHSWRKRVKYLRYQLTTIVPIAAPPVATVVEQWDTLGDLLGQEHDLFVLATTIAENAAWLPAPTASAQLTQIIKQQRDTLTEQALKQGMQLYQGTAEQFTTALRL